MRDDPHVSQHTGRQRILIGAAIGLSILAVVIFALIRLLTRDDMDGRSVDLPVERTSSVQVEKPQMVRLFFANT